MLCQNSKKGTMPRDYTLILGDSYAAGWGDWLQTADIGTNAPHATHHLIYEKTGVDTVQGAFAGASVTEALVRKPVNRYRFLRKTLLYKIEDPRRILWFFYEGNDFVDDLHRLESGWYKEHSDRARFYEQEYFREFLDSTVLKSDALYYDVRRFKLHYNFAALHLALKTAENLFVKHAEGNSTQPAAKPGTNCFQSASGKICIDRADVLCPSFDLPAEDMKLAVHMAGESLDYLREFFPRSEITIVYIPSPATSYPIISEEMSVLKQDGQDPLLVETKVLFDKSDEGYEAVRALAAARGVRVIDTRADLRRAAARLGILHGPKDFFHLNRKGYEALAESVMARMDAESAAAAGN